jgi:hypothetical protein
MSKQNAAARVWSALWNYARPRGQFFIGQMVTDRALQQFPPLRGFSKRFIQKGLRALEDLGLISRRRVEGRREITILGRLAGVPRKLPPHEQNRGRLPEGGHRKGSATLRYGTSNPAPKAATPEQEQAIARAAEQDAKAKAEQDEFLRQMKARRAAQGEAGASSQPSGP